MAGTVLTFDSDPDFPPSRIDPERANDQTYLKRCENARRARRARVERRKLRKLIRDGTPESIQKIRDLAQETYSVSMVRTGRDGKGRMSVPDPDSTYGWPTPDAKGERGTGTGHTETPYSTRIAVRKFLEHKERPGSNKTRVMELTEAMYEIAVAKGKYAVQAYVALMNRAYGTPKTEEDKNAMSRGGVQLVYVNRPSLNLPVRDANVPPEPEAPPEFIDFGCPSTAHLPTLLICSGA